MPDLLDHMAENYPNLTVKNGVMGRNSDIESTTMANYKDQVCVTQFFSLDDVDDMITCSALLIVSRFHLNVD